MNAELKDKTSDRITGAIGLVLSVAYVSYAKGIEDSMLADAVGASGVPIGVGAMLGLASFALLIKTGLQTTPALASSSANIGAADAADESTEQEEGSAHPHRMALCLLLVLAVYVALLPLVGYVIDIGLLIGAIAWLAGARKPKSILICALLAGPLLWLMFDWALQIRLPKGLLLPLLGA
jgi:putative tricarboxylic transport membrane protein